MWRDSRRHLFGGQHEARLVNNDFQNVSDKRRARLTLSVTTEPWTVPGSTQLDDPLPTLERNGTAFLVDTALPKPLQEIALSARREFGAGVSIVTRMDALGATRLLEVLPTDREATRMRIKALPPNSLGMSTGESQYSEYEFAAVPLGEAEQWVLEVGRLGLLETTLWRGRIFSFINGPATPEAVAAAGDDPRVSDMPIWKSWRPGNAR